MDRSKAGPSVNCLRIGRSRCWETGRAIPPIPLLLKFLDARDMLSVQVHPSDRQTNYLPAGETGKTEAWVVLEAGTGKPYLRGLETSHHGRQPATGDREWGGGGAPCTFTPKPGRRASSCRLDGFMLWAAMFVVFEVQQNSDVTFRLYDWDHVEYQDRPARALQVDQAMACMILRKCDRSGGAGGGRGEAGAARAAFSL